MPSLPYLTKKDLLLLIGLLSLTGGAVFGIYTARPTASPLQRITGTVTSVQHSGQDPASLAYYRVDEPSGAVLLMKVSCTPDWTSGLKAGQAVAAVFDPTLKTGSIDNLPNCQWLPI